MSEASEKRDRSVAGAVAADARRGRLRRKLLILLPATVLVVSSIGLGGLVPVAADPQTPDTEIQVGTWDQPVLSGTQREAFSDARTIGVQNPTDFGYPRIDGDSVLVPVTSDATRSFATAKPGSIADELAAYEAPRSRAAAAEADADERLALTSPDLARLLDAGTLRFVAGEQTFEEAQSFIPDLLTFTSQESFKDADAWSAAPDPVTGKVKLSVEKLTDSLADALEERYGASRLEVEIAPNPHLEPTDSRRYDDSPFYGATRLTDMWRDDSKECSSAFAWSSSGTYPLLTAGHCAPAGDDMVSTGGETDIGIVVNGTRESWNSGAGSVPLTGHSNRIGDVALIRLHSGYQSYARIWRGSPTTTAWNTVTQLAGWASPGDPFCFSGKTTGEHCGWTVLTVDAGFIYGTTELAYPVVSGKKPTGVCIDGGDSGGAIFSRHDDGTVSAKGVLSGARDLGSVNNCVSVWTDIHYPINAFPGTIKLG